ncbi:MAG: GDP-mannose 4,6-dehydratase [Chloroflexota bacterium]
MRAFVTGSKGFVGGWLTKELEGGGHQTIEEPEVDVTDRLAVWRALNATRPDAVVHLAAISSAHQAAADLHTAFAVAVAGTINVFEGVRALPNPPVVLITGSSEVYRVAGTEDLPLSEMSPLAPATPYALSKAAQESVALSYAARFGLRVVVTRSFNHTGPGQRPLFVVPAIAQRVLAAARGQTEDVAIGNADLRRDISDVRDVVNAYRLLLEAAIATDIAIGGLLVNVCSGRTVSIRWIIDELCRLAGVQPRLRVDQGLLRAGEALEVRGDPALIKRLVDWTAATEISKTVADVWDSTVNLASISLAPRTSRTPITPPVT